MELLDIPTTSFVELQLLRVCCCILCWNNRSKNTLTATSATICSRQALSFRHTRGTRRRGISIRLGTRHSNSNARDNLFKTSIIVPEFFRHESTRHQHPIRKHRVYDEGQTGKSTIMHLVSFGNQMSIEKTDPHCCTLLEGLVIIFPSI